MARAWKGPIEVSASKSCQPLYDGITDPGGCLRRQGGDSTGETTDHNVWKQWPGGLAGLGGGSTPFAGGSWDGGRWRRGPEGGAIMGDGRA